ncbi:MAG: aspartate aminotransferase family protein [Desulfobacteraceae bacterium]|nr:MAG: aspartate aminotransferase family protein [Desulfobacteraceae bacterium]
MNTDQLIALSKQVLLNTYKRPGFVLEKGQGSYVWDKNGRKYLDLIGGIATTSVGHGRPEIVRAAAEQAAALINPSNLFYSEPQLLLAQKLIALSGMDKCFLCNSGTEAIEAAIKLARKNTKKEKIIAMNQAFHGRTLGALSATYNEAYKKPFAPLVPGFVFVPYGDIRALENTLDENTAAVLIEPIQGEAGVLLPPAGYLKQVADLCRKKQILLMLDEIQTGNGRTGKFFCFQHENLKPDIVTLAKGIANGVPLGVVLTRLPVDFEPGDHGSTFGGNCFSCAVALAVLRIIEDLMPEIPAKSDTFMTGLRKLKSLKVKEIRGKGLMIALELHENIEDLAIKCADQGLLVNAIQNRILRFLPPLTITHEEIQEAVNALEKVLK